MLLKEGGKSSPTNRKVRTEERTLDSLNKRKGREHPDCLLLCVWLPSVKSAIAPGVKESGLIEQETFAKK